MTRQIEKLRPIKKNEVTLYTCGPTVYSQLQVGNWATNIRWDILVRTLRELGYKVDWVMNITDVGHLTSDSDEGEDKLEKGAKREGKTAWQIADFYTEEFLKGMKALNITDPTYLPRATQVIKEQIELLQILDEKGFTYKIDDGVYFDTSKLSDYGKLARLDADELRAGARVEFNPQKRNATDFALWKFSPKNTKRDMEWESPWGIGFPGWHLECSAIAMKYLGKTIDIHAGGIDHIPVHHTNEIAQSETATGKTFANIWLHGNFITADGKKLSKSLGNSYNLYDIAQKGYNPLDLRMLFLQSHYRTQANFTWEALEAAKNWLQNMQEVADLRFQAIQADNNSIDLTELKQDILKSMQSDLNTPEALAILSKLNTGFVSKDNLKDFKEFLQFIDRIFGLELTKSKDITDEQKLLIQTRQTARLNKDFALSDKIRDELEQQGIGLRDTPKGAFWYRLH
ncbi:MAG: cysteine--tRNA ligase [Candidatus Woesebacteria bacterium]